MDAKSRLYPQTSWHGSSACWTLSYFHFVLSTTWMTKLFTLSLFRFRYRFYVMHYTEKKIANMFIYISYLISSKLQGDFLCSWIEAWMKCIRSHLDCATSQLNLNFLKKSWRLPFMFSDKTVNKTKIYPLIAKMLTCVIRS